MELVQKTSAGRIADTQTFVLTSETPDRVGDIVVLDGLSLKNFKENPVALVHHNSGDFPVGAWKNIRRQGDVLLADLHLAAKGTSRVADLARSLIEQGILRAVSIGFRAMKAEPIQPRGIKFFESELLEASLVSVPMNPRAVLVAKSLNMTPEEVSQFFVVKSADNNDYEDNSVKEQSLRFETARKRAIYALVNATRIQRKFGEL
jgi:HK97 family phage prohead protease